MDSFAETSAGPGRRLRLLGLATLAAATLALAVPGLASATTLWVSKNAPSAPYNTCEHPGDNSIQAAINGPGTSIHVCGGTYEEQLQIERAVNIVGYEGATLKLPATTVNATTPCDVKNEAGEGVPIQDAVSICGAVKVQIKTLAIDAVWPGEPVGGLSCAYKLYGVVAAGGASLELVKAPVTGARPSTINGCQYGVGIQIGTYYDPPATGKLLGESVSGYQKNGITVEGSGSHATITAATVTGAGPIAAIAQNGIGVEYGAGAVITGGSVSGNECENSSCGPNALTQYQSDGVYFYEAAAGSVLKGVTLSNNDVGAEAADTSSTGPSINGDHFTSNRDESVDVSQGSAVIDSDVMSGANVGIELLQYAGQPYAIGGTASHDTISGTSQWAVLGRSDGNASDLAGSFTISSSKISGNPGPRPQESVESENKSLRIYAEKDT